MTAPDTARIRVGLLTPYFAFFEQRFPPDYRASLERYAADLAAALAAGGLDVTPSGLVHSAETADAAAARFAEARVDVVVCAATMASPPSWGSRALTGHAGPVIVWDDNRVARIADDCDEVEATRASSILGSIMLANVLGRDGRTYVTVSTGPGDAEPVIRAVRGAAAAHALRGARLGLLGGIIPGYGDVVLDAETAGQLGIELVTIAGESVSRALADARGPVAHDVLPRDVVVEPAAAPLLDRSLRVHRFLRSLVAAERLDALALNCHSDVLRFGEELGVVGCLASTLLWGEGLPVACTGDAATAVALMLAARISGSAQYCEGYLVEGDTGELVVSSCGMADLSQRSDGVSARLCANELYPGRHGEGITTKFAFAPGPATILGFGPATPTRPARLVVSPGELSGRGFTHLNGPSGSIAFDRPGRPGAASRAWIDAAPAHHLALIRGDRSEEIRVAARILGIELIEIHEGGV